MWLLTNAIAAITVLLSGDPASSLASTTADPPLRFDNQVAIKESASRPAQIPYNRIPSSLLDSTTDVDLIAAMVSSNEGKPNSIVWNDNGAGISVGLLQANQKKGQLPELIRRTAESSEGRTDILAAFGQKRAARLFANPEIIRKWRFKRHNALGKGISVLSNSQTFQNAQLQMLRENIVRAAEISAHHNIESSAAVAIVADLMNQWGERGAHRFLPNGMTDDSQIASQIVSAVERNSDYGARYRGDLKKAVANGLSFTEPFSID